MGEAHEGDRRVIGVGEDCVAVMYLGGGDDGRLARGGLAGKRQVIDPLCETNHRVGDLRAGILDQRTAGACGQA